MENNAPPSQLVFSTIQFDELLQRLRAGVREEFRAIKAEELMDKYLSPEKSRKLFDPEISLVTLSAWAKKGLVNKHHIGGRTYYKYCELMDAVKSLKKYKH